MDEITLIIIDKLCVPHDTHIHMKNINWFRGVKKQQQNLKK